MLKQDKEHNDDTILLKISSINISLAFKLLFNRIDDKLHSVISKIGKGIMKECPRCKKTYEDKWQVCQECHVPLVEFGSLANKLVVDPTENLLKNARKRASGLQYLKSFIWGKRDFISTLVFAVVLLLGFAVLAFIMLNMKLTQS